MTSSDRFMAWLTLSSAIAISATAAFFSIDGMIAIFSETPWKAGIMTTTLEIGKIVTALWLHANWGIKGHRLLKAGLMISVAGLMMLTSMGIFGTLSKSFQEKSVTSYADQADQSLIQTQLENLRTRKTSAEASIARLDSQVQLFAKSQDEKTALRSVRLAQRQEKARQGLQNTVDSLDRQIADAQIKLNSIQQKRYAENADVGPVIYFAEMIYGQNSADVVDKAVRWVIILIVICFDPLAIMLLIAAQVSFSRRQDASSIQSWDVHQTETVDADKVHEEAEDVRRPDPFHAEDQEATTEEHIEDEFRDVETSSDEVSVESGDQDHEAIVEEVIEDLLHELSSDGELTEKEQALAARLEKKHARKRETLRRMLTPQK